VHDSIGYDRIRIGRDVQEDKSIARPEFGKEYLAKENRRNEGRRTSEMAELVIKTPNEVIIDN
jgi:hypothetical protein